MSWKDLIFEKKDEPKKESEPITRFPSSNSPQNHFAEKPTFTTSSQPLTSCEPYMEQVMNMYEQGFDSLNMDGYDFFEFYKAIMDVGDDNPQAYKMGMSMARSMGANIDKQTLINQAETYIKKIEEVHQSYMASGKSKESELLNKERVERESLVNEIGRIREEIDVLERNLQTAERELASIKTRYSDEIRIVECKNQANDQAKDVIIKSIRKVVNGIKSNI